MIPEMIFCPLLPRLSWRGIITFCSELSIFVLLCAMNMNGQNLHRITSSLHIYPRHIPDRRVVPDIAIRLFELVREIILLALFQFILEPRTFLITLLFFRHV